MTPPQPPAPSPPTPFSRYQPIIDDWDAFQESLTRPLPTIIWANLLKATPEQLAAMLTEADIPHEPIPWLAGGFRLPANFKPGLRWEYLAGLYQVQEEVALLPVLLMNIRAGDRLLDMCAAPGNKTAQLAVALQNKGTVVANDRSVGRMRAASQTLNRLGLVNITSTTVDAANYSKHAGLFDSVLADVPCTCEGTCRRDRSLLKKPVKSGKLVGTQKAILRKAVQLCHPGGQIIYATCTFAPEENEAVVNAILEEVGDDIHLIPRQLPAGIVYSEGITQWEGQSFHPSLKNAIRIYPHQNDTGGFFIAVLEKRGNEEREARSEKEAASLPRRPIAVSSLPQIEEREPWLTILEERFGIPKSVFDDFVIYRVGKKKLYIVNRDHEPLEKPRADASGMHFMRVEGKYPKLTTGAAMLFGVYAQRNVLDLTAVQAYAFFQRQEFSITNEQAKGVTGNGYLMLRYKGIFVGQGVFYSSGNRVESHFPKAWVRQNLIVT